MFQGGYLTLDPAGAAAAIFEELPKEQGEAWARKLPGQTMGAFTEKLTSTSHYDVPITYVKCTRDSVVAPAHQQRMINDVKDVSRSSVDVIELACGHCPMVVDVERTVNIIQRAASTS
jgi:pimeloyl-ACP methyl ester carboxylesterase